MRQLRARSIMAEMGMISLGIAFVAAVTAVVCAVAGWRLQKSDDSRAPRAWRTCGIAMLIIAGALSAAVVVLAWCFLVEDFSLIYVAYSHPQGETGSRWLSRISAIWAGKSGSLLVWAWLVSLWASPLAVSSVRKGNSFEGAALGCVAVVLTCLIGILLFSSDNMPFWPTPAELLDESGNLVAAASGWGMSETLDHWAMDIHPFLLFDSVCSNRFVHAWIWRRANVAHSSVCGGGAGVGVHDRRDCAWGSVGELDSGLVGLLELGCS